jgi:hypothetical protein
MLDCVVIVARDMVDISIDLQRHHCLEVSVAVFRGDYVEDLFGRCKGRPADLWSCGVPKIGGTINNYWIILDTTGRYCFHHPQQLSYCSGWLGGCKVLTQKTSALQKFRA